MKPGEILQVIADNPQSFINIPEAVIKHGYEFVKKPEKEGQQFIFYICVPER